jgi:hypothetical protein
VLLCEVQVCAELLLTAVHTNCCNDADTSLIADAGADDDGQDATTATANAANDAAAPDEGILINSTQQCCSGARAHFAQ